MKIQVPEHLTRHHGGGILIKDGRDQFSQVSEKFAETFELWGGLKSRDRVLDIGCGPGRMAIGIGERFGWTNDYIGFDINKADIEFCNSVITKQFPSFRFYYFDVENSHYNKKGLLSASTVKFPAEDHTIDFVFATSVYTHLYNKDVAHYLKETARVCRGRSLSTWFIIDEKYEAGRKAGKARFNFPHIATDGTYIQDLEKTLDAVGHKIELIEQMHRDAGLKITDIYPGEWTGQVKGRHSQDVIVSELA